MSQVINSSFKAVLGGIIPDVKAKLSQDRSALGLGATKQHRTEKLNYIWEGGGHLSGPAARGLSSAHG